MGFRILEQKLSTLLQQADRGEIRLPDLRRVHWWEPEKVRSLLVTLTLGYPFGAFTTARIDREHPRIASNYIRHHSPHDPGTPPELLLLDGQGRLTALWQALRADSVLASNTDEARRYYIDIALALGDPARRDEAVFSVPANGIERSNHGQDRVRNLSTTELELEHGYFPARLAFDEGATTWLSSHPNQELAQRFRHEILQPMHEYVVPVIELDTDTTPGALASVFDQINTKSESFTMGQLLLAKLTVDPDFTEAHRKRKDVYRVGWWPRLGSRGLTEQHPVLKAVTSAHLLQAITLLVTRDSAVKTSAHPDAIMALEPADYLEWAPRVCSALEWVGRFLEQEHLVDKFDVPYPDQLVPLIAARALLGEVLDADEPRQRLRHWLWCGILGEVYVPFSGHHAASDVDELPAWLVDQRGEVPAPQTVRNAAFIESTLFELRAERYELPSPTLRGVFALMRSGCLDWHNRTPFDRPHHRGLAINMFRVFPHEWIFDRWLDGTRRVDSHGKRHNPSDGIYDCVVNLAVMGETTEDLVYRSDRPTAYLADIVASAPISNEELDVILRQHHIDPALLRAENFDAFFIARRRGLVDLIEQAMGKPVVRDIVDPPTPARDTASSIT